MWEKYLTYEIYSKSEDNQHLVIARSVIDVICMRAVLKVLCERNFN